MNGAFPMPQPVAAPQLAAPQLAAPVSAQYAVPTAAGLAAKAAAAAQQRSAAPAAVHLGSATAQQPIPHAGGNQQAQQMRPPSLQQPGLAAVPPARQPAPAKVPGLPIDAHRIAAAVAPEDAAQLRRQLALFERQQEALRKAQALQSQLLQSIAAAAAQPATAAAGSQASAAAAGSDGVQHSAASQPAAAMPPPAAPAGSAAAAAKAAAAAAAAGAAVAPAPAPKAQLSPVAEQQLLAFFSLQDTLSKDEARMLAQRCDCTEDAVRSYFTKLRNTVRAFIQRAHRRAGGRTAPAAAHAAGQSRQGLGAASAAAPAALPNGVDPATAAHIQGVAAAAGLTSIGTSTPEPAGTDDATAAEPGALEMEEAARKRSIARLQQLLDASGGIADPDKAGPFAAAMQTESSVSVRLAILQAVLATHSTATLAPLVAVGTCGTLLAAWLSEAELDRQKTFLRLALNAAARLPWTLPLLRSGGFLQAVNRLHKTPALNVAAEAGRMLQIWARLESPYADGAPASPTSTAPAYQPPRTLAFSGTAPAAPTAAQTSAAAQAAANLATSALAKATSHLVVSGPAIAVAAASGAPSSAWPVPLSLPMQQADQQRQQWQQLPQQQLGVSVQQQLQWQQQSQQLHQQQQQPQQQLQQQPATPYRKERHAGVKAVSAGGNFMRGYQAIKQAKAAQKKPDIEQVRQKERARLASTALPPGGTKAKQQKPSPSAAQQQQAKAKRQSSGGGGGDSLLAAAARRLAVQTARPANTGQTMAQVQMTAVMEHRRHKAWVAHHVARLANEAKKNAVEVDMRVQGMRANPRLVWPPPLAEAPVDSSRALLCNECSRRQRSCRPDQAVACTPASAPSKPSPNNSSGARMQVAPADMPPGCGEDSAEAPAQQKRCAQQPAATYILLDLIPDSPSEPWAAASAQLPDTQLPCVPFVPTDQVEMQDQISKMVKVGVRLPTYVGNLYR